MLVIRLLFAQLSISFILEPDPEEKRQMPQIIGYPDLTVLVTVVQAGDAPGGGGQLPEFPGGGGGGQGAGPTPTLLPRQRSFHPLPATECHRSSG